jgi:hypothetical protein
MVEWAGDAVTIAKQLHAQNPALYDSFGSFRSNMLSLVRADGAMDLYDGVIRARDASGKIFLDGASDQSYLDLIEEEVRPWTYMKFPHLKSLGRDVGWYRVGPLARVQNCDFIPSPLAEAERREFIAWGRGEPVHATLAYHWARMIEVLHSMEVIRDLLADPELLDGDLMTTGERTGKGVGIIEAPRGTLIHDYRVGDDDLVTMCNLIVSTTHNNQAMNEAVRSVARQFLDGRELTEGLLNHIEIAIRAYDPCLSCATHALGRMPLDVVLQGPTARSSTTCSVRPKANSSGISPRRWACPRDGAGPRVRLGQPESRRRRARSAVRRAAARRARRRRPRGVFRRLPAAGGARARPRRPRARAVRRREPDGRRAVRGDDAASVARRDVHDARDVARRR